MERLTIKELAAYLPYELKVIGFNNYINKDMVCDLTDRNLWTHVENQSKPLLRPLSSLTEEIEHNGEMFVPLDELTEGETVSMSLNDYADDWDSRTHYSFKRYVEEWVKGDIHHMDFLPYGFIEKLHEWHFDTAKLLGRGLAIPIKEEKEVEGESRK